MLLPDALPAQPARASALPMEPDLEQLVLAAVHVLCHGPYASARQRARLLHPVTEPLGHRALTLQAEVVLATVVKAAFAELRPEALARICQATEQARSNWPVRLRELDGGSHWRPE